jgi:5-methylcytosine-specific restriction protein A
MDLDIEVDLGSSARASEMPSWIKETAQIDGLVVGQSYSKRQAAEAMSVSLPMGSRDWGGLVRFSNGILLFITLKKGADRYAEEHRYDDRFDGDLLYWDSRASHDKTSNQVKALRIPASEIVAFARVSEKGETGRTQPFVYLGSLEFVDWWGRRPVHFTWRLCRFPDGLGGSDELDALAEWKPHRGREPLGSAVKPSPRGSQNSESAPFARALKEGARGRVTANRYERDPRARQACLESYGSTCFVCGFDYGLMYGSLGAGFIFVHHRVPVAIRAQQGEYELDPVRDLVPICGNCHAIVHRREASEGPVRIPPRLSKEATARLLELRALASGEEWESIG